MRHRYAGGHDDPDETSDGGPMIEGDVSILLQALGARDGDATLQRALELIGGDYEVDVFDDDDQVATYLVMADQGVEFLLTDGSLSSVFVYATRNAEHAAFERWTTLVRGIDVATPRVGVMAVLGEPKRSTADALLYEAGSGFVQFDFDDEQLTMMVVMSRDLGA